MQQLTAQYIRAHLVKQGEQFVWHGEFPRTQPHAVSLQHHMAKCLNATAGELDWGADRLQVRLSTTKFDVLFNIEWLCEAVWLEPIGVHAELETKQGIVEAIENIINSNPH